MSKFKEELSEIATLREKKGEETKTLKRISVILPKVTDAGEWKTLAKLYWESHLVWQHTVMAELSKPEKERNQKVMELGTKKIMGFAEKAKDVIEEHGLKDMLGGAYRFLGRAATYAGNHLKSKRIL